MIQQALLISNLSPVYENCEFQPAESYENILQDLVKTNNKGKNKEAMHTDFASTTPCKPAQVCTKKRNLCKILATHYDIVSSAVDNISRKSFDEQTKIIRLCNKVKQNLPKLKNFNGCDSLKNKIC